MNVTKMNNKEQITTLKDLCKKISELDDSELRGKTAETLLSYLSDGLSDLDYDDAFGTEGWEHFFGING